MPFKNQPMIALLEMNTIVKDMDGWITSLLYDESELKLVKG